MTCTLRRIAACRLCRFLAVATMAVLLGVQAVVYLPLCLDYRQELIQDAERRAQSRLHALAEDLGPVPPKAFAQHALNVETGPGWVGTVALSPDGDILASAGAPLELAAAGDPALAQTPAVETWLAGYEVYWPATHTGLDYAVAARLDTAPLAQALRRYIVETAAVAFLVASIATAAIVWIVAQRVILPVMAVRDSVRQAVATPGRGSAAPPGPEMPTPDEIAELAERTRDLAEKADHYRRIFEESFDAIFILDIATRRIVDANPEACRLLDYTRAEIAGLPMERVHPDEMDELTAFAQTVLCEGCGRAHRLSCSTRKGERIPADISATCIEWENRPAMLAIAHDLRPHKQIQWELNEAKVQAEAAGHMKTRFLATMSHELRTPLNAIIGFSEALEQEYFGPLGSARNREYIQDIRRSGEHLRDLVGNILDLSHIEAGEMRAVPEDLRLADALGEAVEKMAPTAEAKGVRMLLTPPEPETAGQVHADRGQLHRMLLNLLSNAIKFTPAGGTVRVAADTEPDGRVTIHIADEGSGIADADPAQLLHPFAALPEDAMLADARGPGLGLPLTRHFARLNGGTLDIESTPGAGTTVSITLPADSTQATTPAAPNTEEAGQTVMLRNAVA